MRKILIILLTAVFLIIGFTLISCNDPDSDGDPSKDGKGEPYSVTFRVDGNVYQTLPVPTEGTLTFPESPVKNGYTFVGWFEGADQITEINAGTARNVVLDAKFNIITYTATFVADGITVDTCNFNIDTLFMNPPAVPTKKGYSGSWETFALGANDLTVNAIYTPITYTATFTADGNTVAVKEFTVENMTFEIPSVPDKEGHFGMWEFFVIGTENIVINALYTAGEYVVTFMNGTTIIGEVGYTYGDTAVTEPTVPLRQCYNGRWESYTLSDRNITVRAEYTVSHTALTRVFEVSPKCNATGNIQYWSCNGCDKYFSDANGTQEISDKSSVITPTVDCSYTECVCIWCGAKDHSLTHHARIEPKCNATGNIEYWSCSKCTKNFSDQACNSQASSVTLSTVDCSYTECVCIWCGAKNHYITYHTRIEPKCNATGNIEYWSCSKCTKNFSDQACNSQASSVTLAMVDCSYTECVCIWCGAKDHSLTHHARIEPKCNATGSIEYWSCSKCTKNFSDQACNSQLSSITLATVACQYTNLICIWCQTPETNAYQITYMANGGAVNGTANGTYSIAKHYDQNFMLQQTLHINNGVAEFTRSGYQLIGYSTVQTTSYEDYTTANNIQGFSNLGGVCEVPRSTNMLTLYPVWAKETDASSFGSETVTYSDIFYAGATNTLNAVQKRDTTGIEITSYSGSNDTVVIPEYINGSPVIGIAANAFTSSSVKKIVIPKTVKKIASGAFSKCSNLAEIVFFDSLQYVYNESFPSSVKTIVMNSTKLPTYAGNVEGSFCIKYERVRFYRNAKKIIVLSGMSTLHGLNSKLLYDNFNGEYEVVNYGTNGSNESVFFLEVIAKYTTSGDIVVLAPEWTSNGMMGDTTLNWKMFRGNNQCYDIFREVDMRNYTNFWGAYTDCQIGKLISSNKDGDWAGLNTGKEYQHPNVTMNKYGDLLGSRNQNTLFSSDPMMFDNQMTNERATNINKVNTLITAKGGILLFSFGTADAASVARKDASWKSKADSFTQTCANLLDCPVISNIGTYIMGENDPYVSAAYQEIHNSQWHCTYYGANVRTVELTYDIKQYLVKKTDSWENYTTRESHRNSSAYKVYDAAEWNN